MPLPVPDPSTASDAPRGGPEADLAGYATYNPWSFVALGLGLLSLFVLYFPLMFVAVVLAVAAALWALYEIEHDATAVWGRSLAIAGLTLALGCGSFVIARHVSRSAHLRAEGARVAQAWVALIQAGRLEEAHQMTLEHRIRQPATVNLKKFYADSHENFHLLQQYFDLSPLDKLRAAPRGTLELEQTLTIGGGGEQAEIVDQIHALHYTQGGRDETLRLRIVVERTLAPGNGQPRWRISNVVDPNVKGW